MAAKSSNMLIFMVRNAWQYAGTARPRLLLFYVMLLAANICIAFQPVVLAHIIDTIQDVSSASVDRIVPWAILYGSLTVSFWLLHGPARVIERRTAFTIFAAYTSRLYKMVTEMPLRWHQDHHSGDTINRINKASWGLFAFAQEQFFIIQMTVRFSMALLMLGMYSAYVLAASLSVSIVVSFILRKYDRALISLIQCNNDMQHKLNATLFDYISNIGTILTLRVHSNTRLEVEHRLADMRKPFWPDTVLNELKWGTVNVILVVAQIAIVSAYIAAHLMRHQPLVVGSVVAIFQYLLMMNQVFYDAAQVYSRLMQRNIDVHSVDDFLKQHAQLRPAVMLEDRRDWKELQINKLRFTHHEGEDVLHHLNIGDFTIMATKKVALIGSSGSGKTTLLTLLRGLYAAQDVALTLDGENHDSLTPLAGFTTLVPQDSEIFENTVLYNLTLGTDVATDIVEQCLIITTFDQVVPKLPKGLETDIRERGVNLSGGQKQRLALARGIIAARFSSLLLLDEPTSSVDLQTESAIFDKLFAAFPDKTIVASIHRLHLLPRFDHICLMRDGAIVEQGDFNSLIAKRGEFYTVWQHHLAQSPIRSEDRY